MILKRRYSYFADDHPLMFMREIELPILLSRPRMLLFIRAYRLMLAAAQSMLRGRALAAPSLRFWPTQLLLTRISLPAHADEKSILFV